MVDLVIGVDAGGTRTRCLVADIAGNVVGTGHARGLNQRSSGDNPGGALLEAVSAAVTDVDSGDVRGGVLAIAGAGEAGLATAGADAEQVWRELGLGGHPVVVPDVLATYATGAIEPAGQVLVAGTGAIAAAVQDGEIVARADGYGWLLGDIGSAVWLAREGLTAALAAMDGRAQPTSLSTTMLRALLGTRKPRTAQQAIAAVHRGTPADLGRLAPMVSAQATAGDAVAVGIVDRGVAGLLASFVAVRGSANRPTVLGGALLSTPGPVRDGVRQGLAGLGVPHPRTVASATAGAAWLALRGLGLADDPAVHAALVSGTASR